MASDSERIELLERRISTLENTELIKRLKGRYVRGCALKDSQEIRECFVPDALIDFMGMGWKRRDDFIDYYLRWGTPKTKVDIQHAMNGVIDITGPNTAIGNWSLYYFGLNLGNGAGDQAGVTYRDEYIFHEGRWWIKTCRSVSQSFLSLQVTEGQPLHVVNVTRSAQLKGYDVPLV